MGDSIYVDGVEITKEDFNFPAEVRSNGDLEIANDDLSTKKAAQRLQVIMNPALADIVNSEDRYNALKDWLEKDGVKDPDLFCTDPKIIMQEKIAQMQQQMAQIQSQMQGMAQQGEQAAKQLQSSKMKKQEADTQAKVTKENTDNMEANTAAQLGKEVLSGIYPGSAV
jgi:regulator of replication initiation timing